MDTYDYFKLLKKELNVNTAYAVAKILDVNKQTALNWEQKKTSFDDTSAVKVANILKIPAEEILLNVKIERTKCPEAREAFKRLSKMLQSVAASVFIGILTLSALPSLDVKQGYELLNNIYYVKSYAVYTDNTINSQVSENHAVNHSISIFSLFFVVLFILIVLSSYKIIHGKDKKIE